MKRNHILAVLLTVLFIAGMTVSAVAEDAAPASDVLRFEEVEAQVLSGNLQIKNNALSLENAKSNDAANAMQSQLFALQDAINSASSPLLSIFTSPTASDELKAVAQSTYTSLNLLSVSLRMQAGGASGGLSKEQLALYDLQFKQVDSQLINAAQSLFPTYYQLQYNIEKLQSAKSIAQEALKAAQAQVKNGIGTAIGVKEAELNITTLDNSTEELTHQKAVILCELNKLLGRPYDAPLTLGDLPSPDLEYAASLNLSADVPTATEQSLTIRYKREELDQIGSSADTKTDDRQKEIKQNEIAIEEGKIGSSLTQKYYSILEKTAALRAEEQKSELLKAKLEQAQKQAKAGVLSALELKNAQNAFDQQQIVLKTSNAALFWEIESYRWTVKGLPVS